MGTRPFHPSFDALPRELAIFPLGGALLLPDGRLPLNIFEPRYLALVQDALASGRMFGMIQPLDSFAESETETPPLFETGCAGRISSFEETEDGRFLITLTGLCRFRIRRELAERHGYRRIEPDWQPFRQDLAPPPPLVIDRPRLLTALKAYCRIHHMEFNWKAIDRAENHDLTVSLCMICPFEPREKQAFLESADPRDRAETLITLLEMAVAAQQGGPGSMLQ